MFFTSRCYHRLDAEKGAIAPKREDRCLLSPIGVVRTPFPSPYGTPIQPATSQGARGTVEVRPELQPGLADLAGFERIWLLYSLHLVGTAKLQVVPFLDTVSRGIFATRAPARPNALGLSCVRLLAVEGCLLQVADVDMVDGTPLLDIKPYVPAFDSFPSATAGWFDAARVDIKVADERFLPEGE